LKLRNISKSFGAVDVIKGINLDIEPKEFVVFVGPSGCGKSTLLRMIAGLEDITAGDLEIGDSRMNDVDPSKRGIAMVFQSYALYPHMSVRDNMGFALKFSGVPKAEIDKQVEAAAKTLGLQNLMNRWPKELSGGQRQRVAIGRAIVRHPEVFLFDEPLSNLDAELRVHMRIELARLHKSLATTVIYVTHDQVEAMTLADKIVVMRDGVIAQVGAPLDVFDNPNDTFVAGFIGSPKINFLEGVIASRTSSAIVVRLPSCQDMEIAVAAGPSPVEIGAPVQVGLRPQYFSPSGSVKFNLAVEIVENLGAESFIHAATPGGNLLTIASAAGRNLRAGERIDVCFDPAKALLFDAKGTRIR
jgi:lactose/L-arabinose transport system ATP-binding protein